MKNDNSGYNGSGRNLPEPSLWDYINIILRGKWLIAFCLLVVLGSTAFFTYRVKPVFEATATILITTKGQQGTFSFLDMMGRGASINIKNEIEILKSRALAETVAKALIEKQYLDAEKRVRIGIIQNMVGGEPQGTLMTENEIASRIRGAVSFQPVEDSYILRITGRSTDPREAALIANTVAEVYHDRNVQLSRTRSRAVREFLASQLQAKHEALASAEDSLQTYMEKTGVYSLDQEASKVVDQLSKLEAERDAAGIELKSLSTTLATYKNELEKQEPAVARSIGEANDPYIRGLQEQLARWEVQKDVTIAQNPSVVGKEIYSEKLREIDAQVSSLRAKLKQRTNEFLRSLLPGQGSDAAAYVSQARAKIAEVQIEQQSLQAKKEALTSFIGQYEREFERIPQRSMQLARLQRARMSNEKLYLLVQDKFNEAAITEESEFGYIDIVDPAIVPAAPVSPNARQNMLFGGLIGLALGIAITFLREYLDVRIWTPEDLKKLGMPLLSVVPLMDDQIKKVDGKIIASIAGADVDAHLISLVNPLSPISEAYRRVRTAVQLSHPDKPVQTIVVTSPASWEGKTTTISNLAITFAQAGKKTLLVDTDLRKPAIHKAFNLLREPGLTEVLFGKVTFNAIVSTGPIENLWVATCGSVSPNPSELLGSQKMKALIEEMKKRYDIILFDSPPILAVTDTQILASLVDGVIVVVKSGETEIAEAMRGVEELASSGASRLGVVVNAFDPRTGRGGYGYYGYGKYRKYGYPSKYVTDPVYGTSPGNSNDGRKRKHIWRRILG